MINFESGETHDAKTMAKLASFDPRARGKQRSVSASIPASRTDSERSAMEAR